MQRCYACDKEVHWRADLDGLFVPFEPLTSKRHLCIIVPPWLLTDNALLPEATRAEVAKMRATLVEQLATLAW